ncbi:hypothetical protein L6164_024206 [Bauhinia variegata]|uniref:Uncharacterized protein n=2 Tax=Bauhinia variegata TaxID=167791 RepID=A0ACB9LX54_BAUVA|nr:hypothetical protein L6164_024206 [Bauhinia variegata]
MENSGDQFDVIIVGAGVMGSSTAYQTAKRGLKTLLVEQFDLLHHRGSSHGESRTIRATYSQHYYYPLVMESYHLWQQAEAEIGYKVYFKANHFDMGSDDDSNLLAIIDNCRRYSVPHQILRRHEVTEKFSGRIDIPDNWIGVSNEFGGVIKPTKAVAMFQALAHKNGAVLRDNTEVTDIKRDNVRGGVVVSTADGGSFWGKKCVVTVGAWMKKLVKTVSGLELPIQPVETYVCYWRIKEGHEGKYAIGGDFPTFTSHGKLLVYGTPTLEYPGLIKAAAHAGIPCDPDKRQWGPGVLLDSLKEWVEGRFLGMVDSSEPAMKQCCMYSLTPEEDFVIDFLGGEFEKDVVMGGGFSGHGFKMGPVVGRILADMVVHGEAKGVEMRYFSLARFKDNPEAS